uniref:Uncharacterized protein n=1 Tax=Arundo donax TaxID=35708 RepID=A0A0A9AD81_ARUDO
MTSHLRSSAMALKCFSTS